MTKEMAILLNKIFELATYDQDTKTYYLSKKDYLYLNISRNTRIKLNTLCNELGINIEYPNKPLPDIKGLEYFDEYNQIQSKLKTELTKQEKISLEQRKIELRNKIVILNLDLIKIIINHRIEEINSHVNKDDIYQLGYEVLLKYIDRNYLDKEVIKQHISCILIISIERELLHIEKNANYYHQEQIISLKNTPQKKNKLNQKRLQELANLESIISSISIEKELSLLEEDNIEFNNSPLYYDFDEEYIFTKYLQQKYISILISTLPKEKQILLNLYFGLNGEQEHSIKEISKIYGITITGISSSILETLKMIKNTYRIYFLKDIYEIENSYNEEINYSINQHFEEFLIRNLDETTIEFIKPYLNKNQLNFITLYCNNQEYTLKEISKILNISRSHIHKIKKDTIEIIKTTIITSLTKEKQITYEEYIKYLMNIYIKRTKVLKK